LLVACVLDYFAETKYHFARHNVVSLRRWCCDSTSTRPQFDYHSIALQQIDDLRRTVDIIQFSAASRLKLGDFQIYAPNPLSRRNPTTLEYSTSAALRSI